MRWMIVFKAVLRIEEIGTLMRRPMAESNQGSGARSALENLMTWWWQEQRAKLSR